MSELLLRGGHPWGQPAPEDELGVDEIVRRPPTYSSATA
jgi:hypothetical protein